MTGKKHLWIPLTLILLANIAAIGLPANASSTVKIYINPEPPGFVPPKEIGEFVDVEVWIDSPPEWDNTVNGIVGYSFGVHVDPAVLQPMFVSGASGGYWLFDFCFNNGYYSNLPQLLPGDSNASDWFDIAEYIQGWEAIMVGAGGSGNICNLTFQVLSAAYTKIELYDAYYYTTAGGEAGKIPADVVGWGQYFTPPHYEANLVQRSAWKEHAHFDRSKHGDENVPDAKGTPGYQTLFAKVKNIGETNVTVKAQFLLLKGTYEVELNTTEQLIEPGQIVVLTTDFAGHDGYPWTVDDDGTWTMEAICWYYNSLLEVWLTGVKTKTSKFNVVP